MEPFVYMTGSEWFKTRPGGLNRYFEDLFVALRDHGTHVSASAFGEAPEGGSSWGTDRASTASRVFRSLKAPVWRPEMVVDRHFSLYGRQPRSVGCRSPLVVHFQGPWSLESRVAGNGYRRTLAKEWVEKFRYQRADAYVVLSRSFHDVLIDRYGVDESKVRIIPPGVDLKTFEFKAKSPRSGFNVLCVRRLEKRMGINVLLDAWKQIVRHIPEARLTIVGVGSEETNLKRQTSELGLESFVTFSGRVSDETLSDLYEKCDVSVVPSIDLEGFGLIALESMAVGRPPIVTDIGGLPDAVSGLDRTLVISAGSVPHLVDRLLSASEGNVPTPEECRSHAESFNWSFIASEHMALYKAVL